MYMNFNTIIYIVVIFIFSIVILYLFSPNINGYIKCNLINIKWISKDELLKNVDNGDLIFLSGNRNGENAIKFYTWFHFSHVALIIRENNIPYLWEADLGQGCKDGPRVIKFEDKLKRWKGDKIGAWKQFKGDRPSASDLLLSVGKHINKNMDKTMFSWIFSNSPESILFKKLKDINSVFCSELIALTFQDLNILGNEKIATYYTPKTFDRSDIFKESKYFSF